MDERSKYYGIQVFDPAKTYIMHVDIPEGKTPWYKRLWKFIRRIIKV